MLKKGTVRQRYIRSMLPDWVDLTASSGTFQLSADFEFQLQWERRFADSTPQEGLQI